MGRQELPKAKINKALKLKEQGKTYDQIAKEAGIKRGSLSTVFDRYGVSNPQPYLHYERASKPSEQSSWTFKLSHMLGLQ